MTVKPGIDGRPGLLILESDPGLRTQLKWCFDEFQVSLASDRSEAMVEVRRNEPHVVLQDLGLPPEPQGFTEGFETLKQILSLAPHTKIIVLTGNHDRDSAVHAISLGAYDFYQKPVDRQVLRLIVSRAFRLYALEVQNRQLREAQASTPLQGVIATDDAMLRVCRMVEKVAPTDASILIMGESGTGKELLAHAVHTLSGRRNGRFVAINCAAFPEQLLERELFGYERGAFAGAAKQTIGRIEIAHGGTLFLDEIGDMPAPLQAKLLRFLQSRVIERLGGRIEISVDVRVVCAINQNLNALIADQRFRADLYYRIGEAPVYVPPLGDRPGAATVLGHLMLRRFSAALGREKRGFTAEALAAVDAYAWPGNVRELENKVRTAVSMSEGDLITASDLAVEVPAERTVPISLKEVRARAERQAVQHALGMVNGNATRAAKLLGITRPTLYDLLRRYGIRSKASDAAANRGPDGGYRLSLRRPSLEHQHRLRVVRHRGAGQAGTLADVTTVGSLLARGRRLPTWFPDRRAASTLAGSPVAFVESASQEAAAATAPRYNTSGGSRSFEPRDGGQVPAGMVAVAAYCDNNACDAASGLISNFWRDEGAKLLGVVPTHYSSERVAWSPRRRVAENKYRSNAP